LKLAGGSWQTSTAVPHLDHSGKGLTVCADVTLDLDVSRFKPSGADWNKYKISWSREEMATRPFQIRYCTLLQPYYRLAIAGVNPNLTSGV